MTCVEEARNPSGGFPAPRGIFIDFGIGAETVNNLGGYPGGEGLECRKDAWKLPVEEYCACGCGCRCSNGEEIAPPTTHEELRYSEVGKIFDGTGGAPTMFDIVVRNTSFYRPWRTSANGRRGQFGTFGAIDLAQDQKATFEFLFVRPGTNELAPID